MTTRVLIILMALMLLIIALQYAQNSNLKTENLRSYALAKKVLAHELSKERIRQKKICDIHNLSNDDIHQRLRATGGIR